MELKKSKDADMSGLRLTTIVNGVLFAAGLSLASFSYRTVVIEDEEITQEETSKDTKTEDAEKEKEPEPEPEPIVTPPPSAAPPVQSIDIAQAVTEDTRTKESSTTKDETQFTDQNSGINTSDQINAIPETGVVEPIVEEIVEIPDVEAIFSQGSVNKWLSANITYPEIARENGDEGSPVIAFVVEKDGSITQAKVLRSGGSDELDAEALKTVKRMPKYTPAQNGGKTVRSRFQVTVKFKLG